LNRWINPDPAGVVDGLNLFRMVRNNPLRYRDGDGRLPKEYSEYAPSAMVSGYHLNPKTFRRRDVTEQTAAVLEKAVEDGFSHNIPYDAHRIVTDEAIRSIPYGYFENEYLPGRWRMLENFRSAGNGPNATDVTWYQYKQVSKLNNFYGVMPKVILFWNVINEDALRATEKPKGIRERFLASKGNGRSTQRIMDAFGLQATRVERVNVELPEPMNDRVLIAVHVEPKPEYRDLAFEALHAKVEKELRRASRNPISRAAHAVWRTAKRAVLPAHTNIGHR
jgi:insecticidal toxin complex protein TccC